MFSDRSKLKEEKEEQTRKRIKGRKCGRTENKTSKIQNKG